MNRIEEIKDKIKRYSYHGDISANEVEGDIEYLLAKLEQAEKSLERLATEMPGSRDNELVMHRERLAREALAAIRS